MSDTSSPEPGYAYQAGRILAGLNYKIVPIAPGKKYPGGVGNWQTAATDDLDQVAKWLADTNYGVGWAMGLQPNGKYLFCLDIDGEEGADALVELLGEHGHDEAFRLTCQQMTGSGGFHYIFEAPYEIRNSAKQFAPKIDVRGEGGQIVCGPTFHPNGEQYRWLKGPKRNPPQLAPQWVLDRIAQMAEPPKGLVIEGGVIGHNVIEETPFEWLNRTFDPFAAAIRQGWVPGPRRGEEQQMVRPGKESRDGTSATFHHDSKIMNIYSTSVDPLYAHVGKHNRDGSILMTPADWWMLENGITDRSEVSRAARAQMPKASAVPSGGPVATIVPVSETAEARGNATSNLPDEFWESRPWLSHIRQAAHARMASADAILGAILARYSATIPVTYRIPPIVMSASTFDHMSVLVSESSGGKSGAAAIARELLPPHFEKVIRWDQPVGSGEGLVELFYDWVTEENDKGKMVEVHKKVFNAVHFTADEGMALVQTSRRDSTTIGSVLCSAWSGTQLGQANASRDRKRIVEAGTGRVAGVCGIQLSLGHHFLSDEWVRQGLSGRLVFFAAEDPKIPHHGDAPPWPGPLHVEYHPVSPIEIEYDEAIVYQVREEHWTRTTGQRHEAPIDGHARLAKLKISGMIALIEGRQTVTVSDWELASTILTSSTALRDRMLSIKQQIESDEGHRRAETRAYYEEVSVEAKKELRIKKCKDAIVKALARGGNLQRKEIRNKLDKSLVRDGVFPEALDQLAHDGVIHRPKRGDKEGFYLL